ncbi:sce7726 family protein [Flagellimonas lutimaris]|uniref:sce7726 family protein n=1 Tax=Flagellimonas lutimaris TaxID=475082 RepID=UPI003F5CD52E
MSKASNFTTNQLRDYSTLFSRNQVKSWFKNDFTSIYQKIYRYDEEWLTMNNSTYVEYLRYVYKVLESHYQNEYIFKNSFLNECLIKEISSTNSQIFSEFRVGNAVADLAMFNGTSKVFEIKTEMDSAKRLDFQLQNYQRAFNEIYLVLPESKLYQYQHIGKEIGIIVYQPNFIEKFKVIHKAIPNQTVDKNTIMKVLHTHEYKNLVKSHFGKLPKMTSFNQFEKCRELILQIPNDELNSYFISFMKARQKSIALNKKHYREFNQISLALKLSKTERKALMEHLKLPIKPNHVLSTS